MNKANGKCNTCGGDVPEGNINKFYCSEPCRIEGWKKHYPNEVEPNWNSIPKVIRL